MGTLVQELRLDTMQYCLDPSKMTENDSPFERPWFVVDDRGSETVRSGIARQRANASEIIAVDLAEDERRLMARAMLAPWPDHPTTLMARAIGFDDRDDLSGQRERIGVALEQSLQMSRWDWTRALLLLEVAFISDQMGFGREYWIFSEHRDADTLAILRRIQRKLVEVNVRLWAITG